MRRPTVECPRLDGDARRGFTLVELAYAMVLVGVLSVIAVPMLDVDRFRMNAAVVEVATELMAAQRRAVLKGHDMVVAIDEGNRLLRVHEDQNNDGNIQSDEPWKVVELPDGVTFDRGGAPKISDSTEDVTFTQKQGSHKAVTFHRNGAASELGYIYLAPRGSADAKDGRAVQVVRATAKISCMRYLGEEWLDEC